MRGLMVEINGEKFGVMANWDNPEAQVWFMDNDGGWLASGRVAGDFACDPHRALEAATVSTLVYMGTPTEEALRYFKLAKPVEISMQTANKQRREAME